MKEKNQISFHSSICMLVAFGLWTAVLNFVDMQAIGPQGSSVGLATINRFFHELTGVHMVLYKITDWLSLIPLSLAAGFALLGLVQWFRRKHLLKVDRSILVLGGFYLVVMAVYILFEVFVVNYRPVLIDGVPEASYPSSTTVLVMCVMLTAKLQFDAHIKNSLLRRCVASAIIVFVLLMVIGRLICGVHWLTDIIGGVLLSAGLVLIYRAIVGPGSC